MTVTVRKATEHDLFPVYELLRGSTLNSAPLPLESRKRMFRPVWGGNEGYYGYVMEDSGEIVGFLGLLFTERTIGGEQHTICEVHSWYVKDSHRKESIKLFLPAVSARRTTLVNYTPTETVYEISRKFGFEDLESRLVMFLPVPRRLGPGVRVEHRKHAILQYLDDGDRKILLDHNDVRCEHYLLRPRRGDGYSYVIIKKMWLRPGVPFGRIIYASDRSILLDHINALTLRWCLRHGLLFVVGDHDELEVEPRLPFSRAQPRAVPSLYRSRDLKPEDLKPPLYTLPLLIGYRLH